MPVSILCIVWTASRIFDLPEALAPWIAAVGSSFALPVGIISTRSCELSALAAKLSKLCLRYKKVLQYFAQTNIIYTSWISMEVYI